MTGRVFTKEQAKEWLARNKRPSIRQCAALWGWHSSSVHRFLNALEAAELTTFPSRTSDNCDAAFLACLDITSAQGRCVGFLPGKNCATTVFASMPQAAGYSRQELAEAQRRLGRAGVVHAVQHGPPSRRRQTLERKVAGREEKLSHLIDLEHHEFMLLLKARYERKQELLLAAKAEVAAAEKLLNDLGRKINGHV